jgi:hypothetical protein
MGRRVASCFVLSVALLGSACSGKKNGGCPPLVASADVQCSTSNDCFDQGYVTLSCVGGTCKRPCGSDADCSVQALNERITNACKEMQTGKPPTFICEQELCVAGCPDVACQSGEMCVNGRCVLYSEGFEGNASLPVVTLDGIGWNAMMDLGLQLPNTKTLVVTTGRPGCAENGALGDDDCAGPAAEGNHYLAVAATPTPAVGTANSGVTCRACACCLDCKLNAPSAPPDLATCPSGNVPEDYACSNPSPASCNSVCSQCDACVGQDAMIGQGLLMCEMQAAARTCHACVAYDSCVNMQVMSRGCVKQANGQYGGACCGTQGDSCRAYANMPNMCNTCVEMPCAPQAPACTACHDAIQCDLSGSMSADCVQAKQTCASQGADGCYPTPIDRPRSVLTDAEQASTSPIVAALQGVSGSVQLEFDYVPFNVGDKYTLVVQGQPRKNWQRVEQQLLVQLCADHCDNPMSWVTGKLRDGSDASIPPLGQRSNGLTLGGQTSIDWTSGHVTVDVPDMFRTANFRFRFLPDLDSTARVGIDAIVIRRKP